MKKDKFSMLEEQRIQMRYMFPDSELFQKFDYEVYLTSQKTIKTMKYFMIFVILFTVGGMLFKEPANYYIINIFILCVSPLVGGIIISLNRHQKIILKDQYTKLEQEPERFKYEILLHQRNKKYLQGWGIVYSLMLAVAYLTSLSLFIAGVVTSSLDFAPLFAFAVILVVLLIPTLFINLATYKIKRVKDRLIEATIEKEKENIVSK